MKWSFRLARIAGIDVRVHATFFLLLAWVGFSYHEAGGSGAMLAGLLFIILLFGCVLLHEFGHAMAARAYGINTPDITLLPIGGLARLERMPDKPSQELVVALAGPAVNVVIALALFLVLGRFFNVGDIQDAETGNVLAKLLAINVFLIVFNMLPAFPMDGGRVLRALLATRLKHAQATRIAAGVGQTMAVLFAIWGFFEGNPFLVFIAVFVFMGAQAEASFAAYKEVVDETTVATIMRPASAVLRMGMTVSEAVQVAMGAPGTVLPVVDASMRFVGVVSAADLGRALSGSPSGGIALLVHQNAEALHAAGSLAGALTRLQSSAQEAFPVVNDAGQLVGILTREDVVKSLQAPR